MIKNDKKTLFSKLLTLCLIASISASSCKKEEKTITTNGSSNVNASSTSYGAMAKLAGDDMRPCTMTAAQIVAFPEEPEEELVDQALYSLAYVMRGEIANDQVADFIFNACAQNESECVTFDALFTQFPQMLPTLNANLAAMNVQGIQHFNNYTELLSALNRRGISYSPVINIPNIADADIQYAPFLSPGIEVAPDLQGDDDIFVWNILAPNDYRPGVLNKAEATDKRKPTMVTSVKATDYQPTPQEMGAFRRTINGQVVSAESTATPYLDTYEFLIKYRYEKNKYSDVAKVCWRYSSLSGSGSWIYGNNKPYSINIVGSVHKNDINTQQTQWSYLMPQMFTGDVVYYNMFEEDWYAATKDLGNFTYLGHTGYVEGRMKFDDEYYLIVPKNANIDPAKHVINKNLWDQVYSARTMKDENVVKGYFIQHMQN